jgi:periplasmic divalent cation tolerance protein
LNQSNDRETQPGYAAGGYLRGRDARVRRKMSGEILMIYCTCPDEQVAESISTHIVEAGLAGCVNRIPGLTSVYKWAGEMKSGTEVLLLIKTAAEQCTALTAELVRVHPYELPEIIAVPIVAGHQPYLDWIRDCCEQS